MSLPTLWFYDDFMLLLLQSTHGRAFGAVSLLGSSSALGALGHTGRGERGPTAGNSG